MTKVFVIFSFINDELHLLTREGKLGHELVYEYELDSTPMSKRKSLSAFYAVVDDYTVAHYNFSPILSVDKFVENQGALVCEALGELWPLFKKSCYKLPSVFLKSTFNFDQATFYGGSFNPWHEGHDECLRRSKGENIIIVPDRNPWKEEQGHACYFESLKELLNRFKDTDYNIFPGFYGLEHANPTVSWIDRTVFKEKSLLMGDDNFCHIFKWKDSSSLFGMINSIEVLFRSHDLEEIQRVKSQILKVKDNLTIDLLGSHPYMDLSSTKVRESKK
ncbi:hypothetical protein A9Q84_02065 [Halobacteriovorax marinus]|uniref:nicotinate-nucleotide adenylyltransferase n=1 Tax=Halobacteriovorax marinus TaxID=97084 RepID=A0A1Y5FGE5_9BACT|nr:hypothetical protein A9Q84_02065 [Halobacteriovorax marinus]